VAASVLEGSMKILGFSTRSRNLKRTHVKVLWDASAAIAAGTTLMEKRMAIGQSGETMDILEDLRKENQLLHASQEIMEKEVEELR
ncbi:hypothetical protein EAI_07113, partial [Harpegnathos saltator]